MEYLVFILKYYYPPHDSIDVSTKKLLFIFCVILQCTIKYNIYLCGGGLQWKVFMKRELFVVAINVILMFWVYFLNIDYINTVFQTVTH